MDLNLLKTFLEVHRVRHFARAADNLFVTPSAVSARIRQLEEQLGVTLFERSRNNIQLTDSGERLLNHAKALVNGWENARYDVMSGAGDARQFTVLGVPSLWDTVLLPWVIELRNKYPDMAIKIESLPSDLIWRRLQQNQADLGFVFEPHAGPELQIVESKSLQLHLVATRAGMDPAGLIEDGYIMVDWGASFATRHAALFPDLPVPSTWVSTGRVAYDLLLAGSGRGCYLPQFMTRDAIRKKRLFKVKEGREIKLPVYAAYPAWSVHNDLIGELLALK
jgi:DNA-binding transcriptional LysR family regulator